MSGMGKSNGLTGILEKIVECTDGSQVSFGEIVKVFGRRSFGPMLLIPAVLAVAPTGAIPGMSLLTGAIIAVLAAQLIVRRKAPFLPTRLLGVTFSRDKVVRTVEQAIPYTRKLDSLLRPRLYFATEPPFLQIIAVVCLVMAATMFPLALLPFAVALPGTAVALMALGLTARDGAIVLFGLTLAGGAVALTCYAISIAF